MLTPFKPRRKGGLLALLLVCGGLGVGGCASAGQAAVGPLMTAFQIIGGRTVERTVSADRETTWTVTLETLSRMEVQIQETERSEEAWELEGIGEEVEVHGKLTRVTPRMTKVSLRVEAGGLLADTRTAEEILNQVALSLDSQPAVAEHEPSDERDALAKTVTSLQGEILHLKAVIDEKENKENKEKQEAASHPPPERNGVAEDGFSWGSGILVIPSSYGVPVLPRPADASAVRKAPTPWRDEHAPVRAAPPPWTDEHAPVRADAPSQSESDGQEVLAAPLVPVKVLTPVRPLHRRQTVR